MLRWVVALCVLTAALAMQGKWSTADTELLVLTVTSMEDAVGTCPSATSCTLRTAIQTANDAGGAAVVIRFSPVVFPDGEPTPILVGAAGLPPLSADGVLVDGEGAGVVIKPVVATAAVPQHGLRITGSNVVVRGLAFEGFPGPCMWADGPGAAIGVGSGNLFRDCTVGVRATWDGVTVAGNRFVRSAESTAEAVGVEVRGSDVTVGGSAGNTFEGLSTGVRVGGTEEHPAGTVVEGNTFLSIIGSCVVVGPGTEGTKITGNTFNGCRTGIAVSGASHDLPASRANTILGNAFSSLSGLAIDLDGDGLRNSPANPESNDGVRFPVITRATAEGIHGTACPGCRVELYLAEHHPGGEGDWGTIPLGAPVLADQTGRFSAELSVATGQWIIATATDGDGNTSEFGPAARVGAGTVACGNVPLGPGWNHVAYFGTQPLVLGDTFPDGEQSGVQAIYEAIDGTTSYRRWLAATPIARTLEALEPGREYWFLANRQAQLPGSFSLSFPVPVQLAPGWNDVVYLGGGGDPRDALASLGDQLLSVARWDSATQRWLRYGDHQAPPWAVGFNQVEACAVYQVLVSGATTLVPLQP